MDFLGVGPLELLVILVLALIVVGPERLPQLARSVGNTIRRLREVSSAVTAEWERELNAASMVEGEDGEPVSLRESLMAVRSDLEEMTSAPSKMLTDAGKEIRSTSGETKRALKGAQSDLQQALASPPDAPKQTKTEAAALAPVAPDPAAAADEETTPDPTSPEPESAILAPMPDEENDPDTGTLDNDGDHVDS